MFSLFYLNQNMQLLTFLGIAVALAMDAFAVAVVNGVNLKNISYRQTFRLSWHYSLCIQHPTRGYKYLEGVSNIMISKMNIYFWS